MKKRNTPSAGIILSAWVGIFILIPELLFAQEAVPASGGVGVAAISGIVVAGLGAILSLAAGIWMLVIAFSVHWAWGVACLFVPFAPLVFLIMHWSKTWKPFTANVVSMILVFAGMGLLVTRAPNLFAELAESEAMKPFREDKANGSVAADNVNAPATSQLDVSETPPPNPPAAPAPELQAAIPEETLAPITLQNVKIGDSIARVRSALGRPTGQIQAGKETIMMYGALTITARDGQVVDVAGDRPTTDEASRGKPRKKAKKKDSSSRQTQASTVAKPVETIQAGGKQIGSHTSRLG